MLNVLLPHRHVYSISSLHGAHGLLSWQVNQHKWPHIRGNSHGRPHDGIRSKQEVRFTVIRVFPQGQNFCCEGKRRQISHSPGWQTLPHSWLPQSRILPHRLPQLYPPTTNCYPYFLTAVVVLLLLLLFVVRLLRFSYFYCFFIALTVAESWGVSSSETFIAAIAFYII